MKEYKNKKETALTSSTQLELILLSEAIEYSGTSKTDTIIDIDINMFYDHCYNKFFKKIIERNVNFLNLNPHHMTYAMQMQFINIMNHLCLYDVEKLKLLDLAESFIKDYREYLNK